MRCGPRSTPTGRVEVPAVLPDVNVLVYAYRREADRHERYEAWLTALLNSSDDLALAETVLTGFVRIVTHPKIMSDPAPAAHALEFVRTLRAARRALPVPGTASTWDHFAELAGADAQVRGNLVPDAWIAALARSHGCRIATADRGFARFPGVEFFDPVPA